VAWIEDNRSLMVAPAGCGKENYDWLLKNVYLVPHTFDEVLTILELEDNRVVTFQTLEVRKTSFVHVRHLMPKPEHLTRQARDKHRESKAKARFCRRRATAASQQSSQRRRRPSIAPASTGQSIT
jgi:hypothetical protein